MVSVSIIGPGRVGGALLLSLPPEKYRINHVIGHASRPDGPLTFFGHEISDLEQVSVIDSDVVFITTDDASITSVAEALSGKLEAAGSVFHTSGALPSAVIDAVAAAGAHVGSIHPLVSISKAELGPERFPGAYFCIEGSTIAVQRATEIVADLRGIAFTIPTRFKTLYHAAAVMACGHLVALFDSAVEVLTVCGLPPEESKEILLPLVKSTVENLGQQSTSSALTGTFGRADLETFTRHLTSLNESVSDDLLEIYLLLGERSLELAAKEGVNPERIDSMLAKMSVAKSRLKW